MEKIMDNHANLWRAFQIIGKIAFSIPISLCWALLPASPVAEQAKPSPIITVDEYTLPLDRGLACPNFDLQIQADAVNRVSKEFLDPRGNVIRTLSAGKGSIQTFTNLSTGTSITLKTGGSVLRTTPNPDGTITQTLTGHNVIVFFPTDQNSGKPLGPTTKLFIGKVVLITDTQFNVFSIQQLSGKQVDICAAIDT
jgi:hypothetical protein